MCLVFMYHLLIDNEIGGAGLSFPVLYNVGLLSIVPLSLSLAILTLSLQVACPLPCTSNDTKGLSLK